MAKKALTPKTQPSTVAPRSRKKAPPAPVEASVPPAVPQAETPAPVAPEAPQVLGADVPAPTAPQDTRVPYLMDLVAQGAGAIARAIRSGKVQVRLPRAAKGKPREQAGGLTEVLAQGKGLVPLTEEDITRIKNLFHPQPGSKCVFWAGRTEKTGRPYGKTTVAGRIYLVHRLAWQMYHGEYPGTEIAIKQRCGNAQCVSEECLYRPDQEAGALPTAK
jgi:hypothetical protein